MYICPYQWPEAVRSWHKPTALTQNVNVYSDIASKQHKRLYVHCTRQAVGVSRRLTALGPISGTNNRTDVKCYDIQ